MKLKVINLLGGPGCGKSTVAAGVFYRLKTMGEDVELVTEYAKDRIYEGHLGCLADQIYIFGKQQRRISRLVGNVKIAVTDSPIILSCLYSNFKSDRFENLVKEVHDSYDNVNIFLARGDIPYTESGRLQNLDEAIELDMKLRALLAHHGIEYFNVQTGPNCVDDIIGVVET